MDYLTSLYFQFSAATKENPVLAGVVSLWGLSVVTFLCRSVPQRIINFITNQSITHLTFNNTGWGDNKRHFDGFNAWFLKNKWSKYSRNLSLDSAEGYSGMDPIVGAGYGRHFFMWKHKLYWFNKSKLDSQGSQILKEEITLSTFGRSHFALLGLIEEFRHRRAADELAVYDYSQGNGWDIGSYVRHRSLDTVIINKELKDRIINRLKSFFEDEQWYRDRGEAYKLAYVFHGLPGTGKTSLIKALASYFNRNVYQLSLSDHSDATFRRAVASVKPGSFLLVEDFDTNKSVRARNIKMPTPIHAQELQKGDVTDAPTQIKAEPASPASFLDDFSMLTLSNILNTLDGIVSLDNIVIFLTTNCLDDIDPALLRKGRIDEIEEIPYLEDAEVKAYIELMFPGFITDGLTFNSIAGCDLRALFIEHKNDAAAFVASIPKEGELWGTIMRCISSSS